MENIIDFSKYKNVKEALEDGWMFMVCVQCNPDPEQEVTGYAPLITKDKHGSIIGGLVCLSCQGVTPINRGRPQ